MPPKFWILVESPSGPNITMQTEAFQPTNSLLVAYWSFVEKDKGDGRFQEIQRALNKEIEDWLMLEKKGFEKRRKGIKILLLGEYCRIWLQSMVLNQPSSRTIGIRQGKFHFMYLCVVDDDVCPLELRNEKYVQTLWNPILRLILLPRFPTCFRGKTVWQGTASLEDHHSSQRYWVCFSLLSFEFEQFK